MKIEVVAPARWITREIYQQFEQMMNAEGCESAASEQCFVQTGQLAGSDEARAAAFIKAMQGNSSDIIWAARGGYGAMRLLPLLAKLSAKKKIFIGYSDVCAVQLSDVLGEGMIAIHGAMPIDAESKDSGNISKVLALARQVKNTGQGGARAYGLETVRAGAVEAPVIVSNLAVLCALLGTAYEPNLPDHILCLEDVGEYYYALDRLLWRLAQSKLRSSIKGIVLGDFTDMEDNDVPWGQSVAEMVAHHFTGIPVAQGLPVGHSKVNVPVIQREKCVLDVSGGSASLQLQGVVQKFT